MMIQPRTDPYTLLRAAGSLLLAGYDVSHPIATRGVVVLLFSWPLKHPWLSLFLPTSLRLDRATGGYMEWLHSRLHRRLRRYRLALRESVNYIQKNLMLKLDQLPKETLFNLAATSAGYTVGSSMPRCGRSHFGKHLDKASCWAAVRFLYPLGHL